MPSPHALVATLLLSCALGLTGCGGPERDPPSPWDHPWGCQPNHYVQLWIPEARHGRWDPCTKVSLPVNVLPDGNVLFWGWRFPLATATDAERLESLTALRKALEEHCDDPAWRGPDGACRLPCTIHADRNVRWSMLRDVLEVMVGPGVRSQRLQWTVTVSTAAGWVRQEADVTELQPEDRADDGGTLRVTLSGRQIELDAVEVEFRLGDRTWTCEEADGLWPDAAPEPAAWDEARAHLAGVAPAYRGVRLAIPETDHAVKWLHVARMLDLILGSGLREVTLPGLGVRLTLLEPEDLGVDPYVFDDDPVVTPGVVFASAVVLLLVFLVTFAPLVRDRPRRRRSS